MPFRRKGFAVSRRQIGAGLLLQVLGTTSGAMAAAAPSMPRLPAEQRAILQRGLNITNWFRFPSSAEPARLRAYLPDSAMTEISAAGFTFVRLCIQPQVLLRPDGTLDPARHAVLLEAIGRLHRAGLGVIVDAHPESWYPEDHPEHRQALFDFWRGMAPALRRFDPSTTFIEVLNEPIFRDHAVWASLQREVLSVIRAILPLHTVILTGADWGSLEGLQQLQPVRDSRVIYSVHDYTPGVLAGLGSFESGIDAAAMARLPFPVSDIAACRAAVAVSAHARTRAIGEYYCSERWNEARLQERLSTAAAWGRRHDVPVMILEFGAHAKLNLPARLAYFAAFGNAARREGLSWALWGYGDVMGFPAGSGPNPAQIDPAVLRALSGR